MFLQFQGAISCRIKPPQNFLFSFLGRVPVIFHWISKGLCNSSFIKEISKFEKKCSTWVFWQFYEPPDLGKNTFTTWNGLKSELYLTCINFWKFHDHLKTCLKVIRLPSWTENVKFSVEMQFFMFLTPWKTCFWINDKFEI